MAIQPVHELEGSQRIGLSKRKHNALTAVHLRGGSSKKQKKKITTTNQVELVSLRVGVQCITLCNLDTSGNVFFQQGAGNLPNAEKWYFIISRDVANSSTHDTKEWLILTIRDGNLGEISYAE